jgi:hypothetical protein
MQHKKQPEKKTNSLHHLHPTNLSLLHKETTLLFFHSCILVNPSPEVSPVYGLSEVFDFSFLVGECFEDIGSFVKDLVNAVWSVVAVFERRGAVAGFVVFDCTEENFLFKFVGLGTNENLMSFGIASISKETCKIVANSIPFRNNELCKPRRELAMAPNAQADVRQGFLADNVLVLR